MFGFFKNKFEKDAQAAIERRAQQMAPKAAAKVARPGAAPSTRDQDIARMQAQVQEFVTPERQALIQNALRVQRAKRQILEELDDESRAKLVAMAITALMREGDAPNDKKK
ncbi:hypothetical protein [Magnetospirillum sp. 64-120]|mgnify:FL=1|uniref:hypothetical protein n=1 Tax=Magnetospirillum sp. 64-120 TaxID=1895778 RepID=UPI00092722B8|nr:hypothetical protein [Magnetospirillum sp. 64-120]OJX72681.1 MAG: hypothetical protein BGO92_20150 [Magnetospirillum sp. 64-120]